MISTLRTLILGANARAEDRVRDTFSTELIDQKIREATEHLKSAKMALASLIQRQRAEDRQIEQLDGKMAELLERTRQALAENREDLAQDAAQAVADMENELTLRRQTSERLDGRILRLRKSVEATHRRIIDLKQGAVAARAMKREHGIQKTLTRTVGSESPMDEAETLIARVLEQDDPFEQGEILRDIDATLDHTNISDRMEAEGFGPKTKARAGDILDRLKAETSTR